MHQFLWHSPSHACTHPPQRSGSRCPPTHSAFPSSEDWPHRLFTHWANPQPQFSLCGCLADSTTMSSMGSHVRVTTYTCNPSTQEVKAGHHHSERPARVTYRETVTSRLMVHTCNPSDWELETEELGTGASQSEMHVLPQLNNSNKRTKGAEIIKEKGKSAS